MRIFNTVSLPVDHPFIVNKYTQWYYAIIYSALQRDMDEYTEVHHIIPASFFTNHKRKTVKPGWLSGDPDIPSNMVRLTYREHYLCHMLLTRMLTGLPQKKMILALRYMSLIGKDKIEKYVSSYYVKNKLTQALLLKGYESPRKGKKYGKQKNPFKGQRIGPSKGKKVPLEVCQRISDTLKGRPSPRKGKFGEPSPKKGRTYGKQKKPAIKLCCEICGKMIASNNIRSHKRKCESIKLSSLSIT